jgi:hypothetical protein
MSLDYILKKPKFIEGVGTIHPIKIKDWDEFESHVEVLLYSKSHFTNADDYHLLDLLILELGMNNDRILDSLEKIFAMCLQVDSIEITHDTKSYYFPTGESTFINSHNFDVVRETIMRQNILFEPKVYKNPAMQKWAKKVLDTRSKNSPNVTLEDMLSTVSVVAGKHYWDLENYTIYQLKYDFQRICHIKEYEMKSALMSNPNIDSSKMKIEHFAENINMFVNPWDGIFKEKSSFKNINSAVGS